MSKDKVTSRSRKNYRKSARDRKKLESKPSTDILDNHKPFSSYEITGNDGTQTRKRAMMGAMKTSLGNISASVDMVGIDRQTHYNWLNSDPEYKKAIEENKERAVDFAEAALMKSIQKGKEASTIFYLKTKGKHRGYIETNHNINTEITRDEIDDMTEQELEEFITKTKY